MAAVVKDLQMQQLPSVTRTLVRALQSERQPTGQEDGGRQPCVPKHIHLSPFLLLSLLPQPCAMCN
jgi:hypothetical protein